MYTYIHVYIQCTWYVHVYTCMIHTYIHIFCEHWLMGGGVHSGKFGQVCHQELYTNPEVLPIFLVDLEFFLNSTLFGWISMLDREVSHSARWGCLPSRFLLNLSWGCHQLFWEHRVVLFRFQNAILGRSPQLIKLSRRDSCRALFGSTGWFELLGCGARAWQRGRLAQVCWTWS